MQTRAATEFHIAQIWLKSNVQNTKLTVACWKLIEEIYDNGSVSINAYYEVMDDDLLLEYNIFADHPDIGVITFQSLPVKKFVASIIGEKESEKRIKFRKLIDKL